MTMEPINRLKFEMNKLTKAFNKLTHYDSFLDIISSFFINFNLAYRYYIDANLRLLREKVLRNKKRDLIYAGKCVLSPQDGTKELIRAINEGKPFLAGRIGETELGFITEVLTAKEFHRKHINVEKLTPGCTNCGFFPPTEENFQKFYKTMAESISNCDLMGVWYNCLEDYVCQEFMDNKSQLTHRSIFDFWNYDVPFSSALRGKKVLVIHPFTETIEKQYRKKEKLFKNTNILPDFELITLKSVQTAAGEIDERFESWFDALDYMYSKTKNIDFDIALIGCGAYGLPLASKIKNDGKIAIHMGGVLQVLFGIKGKRWDKDGTGEKIYNKYWVYPSVEETPVKSSKVENSCYWS